MNKAVTKEDIRKLRNTNVYKMWRRQVLINANYLCQDCFERGIIRPAQEAHHIKPLKTHWKLRLDINNGQALCQSCHNEKENPSKLQIFMAKRGG